MHFQTRNTMNNSTTEHLDKILSAISSEKEMVSFMKIPKVVSGFTSFHDYFQSLESVQSMGSSELISKSSLERSYYYQIMKGTKKPGRDKVLRLCLAAGLNLHQTKRALELSGNASLYSRNPRDIILAVAINQKSGVIETNLLLSNYGEQPLG